MNEEKQIGEAAEPPVLEQLRAARRDLHAARADAREGWRAFAEAVALIDKFKAYHAALDEDPEFRCSTGGFEEWAADSESDFEAPA